MTKPKPLVGDGRCTAMSKTKPTVNGLPQRCGQRALPGMNVCHFHGGKAPNSIRAANERIAEAEAQNWLGAIEVPPMEDPLQALMDLAAEVWAAKEFFKAKIESLRYEHHAGEQLRAEVALYERALDRCMKVLGEITRLGIAERRARIQEAQAVLILRAFERVLDALELSPEQRVTATQVVPRELRALSAAEPANV